MSKIKRKFEKGYLPKIPYAADLHGSVMIYVYCNVVQPQVVGDDNGQLIKAIAIEGWFEDIVVCTFTIIQYLPMQRDELGNLISFKRGKSIVTVHLRKRASSYFTKEKLWVKQTVSFNITSIS